MSLTRPLSDSCSCTWFVERNDWKDHRRRKRNTYPEAAKERARRSGMAKGAAGAAENGDEYEQGAAGTNK